jgi:imidazolonepropionase-like amidohydrolase
MHLEDKVGSIEIGKFADFIIVSDDPLANPSKIREIKVLNTIIGGVFVYKQHDRLTKQ